MVVSHPTNDEVWMAGGLLVGIGIHTFPSGYVVNCEGSAIETEFKQADLWYWVWS